MDWLGFLGSVLGGIAGGLCTLLGVKATIKHNEKVNEKAKKERIIENKPNLVIESYKDIENYHNSKDSLSALHVPIKCEINSDNFDIIYDEDVLDDKQLCEIVFNLINDGKSVIQSIQIVNNFPKNSSLLPLVKEQRKIYIEHKYYNVVVSLDYINLKPGEKIKIKICYLKDRIISGLFSAPLSLYVTDLNNNLWEQPLFIQTKQLGTSILTNFAEYRENTDYKNIDDCFMHPWKW